jgi:hypothetical protein
LESRSLAPELHRDPTAAIPGANETSDQRDARIRADERPSRHDVALYGENPLEVRLSCADDVAVRQTTKHTVCHRYGFSDRFPADALGLQPRDMLAGRARVDES